MADTYIDKPAHEYQGETVDQVRLSALLGVSRVTINEWQSAGLPHDKRTGALRSNEYNSAEVIRWLVGRFIHTAVLESPKDRLARVQADRIEMDIAERKGRLVPVSEIGPVWARMAITIRAEVLRIPQCAHMLDAAVGVEAKSDILQSECVKILTKLADYDTTDASEIGGGDNGIVPPGDDDDGRRMGRIAAHDVVDVRDTWTL